MSQKTKNERLTEEMPGTSITNIQNDLDMKEWKDIGCRKNSRQKIIVGKRFNNLIVINWAYKKNGRSYWLCKCDCGNEKNVSVSDLNSGHVKSCGCRKKITIDLVGKQFNYLFVVKLLYNNKNCGKIWQCLCKCGNTTNVSSSKLLSEHTTSCGCFHLESIRKHGLSKTSLYSTWINMIQRCYNVNSPTYIYYGKRGIKVCERWLGENGFLNFLQDMGEKSEELSLHRKDNDKNYSPENCIWATKIVQANRTRRNRFIEYNGKRMTIAEWSRETKINKNTIIFRLDSLHWSVDKTLTTIVIK